MANIGVIGGGAWGTALAMTASKARNTVKLWAREEDAVNEINTTHRTPFLPAAHLPESIEATTDMASVLTWADCILLVAPAQFTRSVFTQMAPHLKTVTPVVLCAKGIELSSGLLMSEVVQEIRPQTPLVVLSGPGFAAEVAKEMPTAVTIASQSQMLADRVSRFMKTDYFRPYSSTDLITPEVCGAIKNVLAIASGISDGCGFGDNTRAALLTRGLAEMSRFAKALGGKKESVLGLSGIGDLMLTANSHQSRNYSCGYEIGQAGWAKPVLEHCTKTVEGVATAKSVMKRARQLGVDMPICEAVESILYYDKPIKDILKELLARPLRSE